MSFCHVDMYDILRMFSLSRVYKLCRLTGFMVFENCDMFVLCQNRPCLWSAAESHALMLSYIKTNEELDKLIKHGNIVNYIKAQRLSWFGHIYKMPDTRTTKKILKWNLLNNRPKGRPKNRWEDNIIQNLHQMKIKNWIICELNICGSMHHA